MCIRDRIYHVTNEGEASWYELACHVLASAGHDPDRMGSISTAELDPPRAAARPAYSVLDNAGLRRDGIPPLPHWRDAFRRLVEDLIESGGYRR